MRYIAYRFSLRRRGQLVDTAMSNAIAAGRVKKQKFSAQDMYRFSLWRRGPACRHDIYAVSSVIAAGR